MERRAADARPARWAGVLREGSGMETIGCPLCGRAGDRVVIEENGYQGRRCDACGLIFVSPRPPRADIAAIYDRDTAHVSSSQQVRPSAVARLEARHTLRLVRLYRTSGRLVDVGAGGGHFVVEARLAGYQVSAVEANPASRDHIRSLGIPCADTLEGHFDIVYACDVLSHFYDPESEIRTMHAHLSEHGLLVLETGNLGPYHERYFNRFRRFQYPDHLFFFGERALLELLGRTGFRVVAVKRSTSSRPCGSTVRERACAWCRGQRAHRALASCGSQPEIHVTAAGRREVEARGLRRLGLVRTLRVGADSPKVGRPSDHHCDRREDRVTRGHSDRRNIDPPCSRS